MITTRDVRCLSDVLGGDLTADGTQQSLCTRLQRVTVGNQGGHFPGAICGTPHSASSDSDSDDVDFIYFHIPLFRYCAISVFKHAQ